MDVLKVPAEISRVQTMADGGLRLFVDTQELDAQNKGQVMAMHKQLGHFVFAPSERTIDEQDFKDLPKIQVDKEIKSPSKRLYDRMFAYYKETHKTADNFYTWYTNELETYGQEYISKLM